MYSEQVKSANGQLEMIETQITQIETAQSTRDAMTVLKQGNEVLKKLQSEIQIEKWEQMRDDMEEIRESQNEMEKFVKDLQNLRQNSNFDLMKKQIDEENPVKSIKKLIKGNEDTIEGDLESVKGGESMKDWVVQIAQLNMRNDYELPEKFKIISSLNNKDGGNYSSQRIKCLISSFHNDYPEYNNSLLGDQRVKQAYDSLIRESGSSGKNDIDSKFMKNYIFDNKVFNQGRKNLNFGSKFSTDFDFNDMSSDMDLYLTFKGVDRKKLNDEFCANLNLRKVTMDKKTDFLIEPIIKAKDRDLVNPRIYGRIRINFLKKQDRNRIITDPCY